MPVHELADLGSLGVGERGFCAGDLLAAGEKRVVPGRDFLRLVRRHARVDLDVRSVRGDGEYEFFGGELETDLAVRDGHSPPRVPLSERVGHGVTPCYVVLRGVTDYALATAKFDAAAKVTSTIRFSPCFPPSALYLATKTSPLHCGLVAESEFVFDARMTIGATGGTPRVASCARRAS